MGTEFGQAVINRYVAAAMQWGDVAALLVPALPELMSAREVAPRLDGLLLTGSPSNVEPGRYGEAGAPDAEGPYDPARDAMSFDLINAMLDLGKPVLGVCRGFQEINVAFGGTLHQKLHEVPGHLDHRDDDSQPLEVQYGPAHDVTLEPGGVLRSLTDQDRVRVNSLHSQGIDRLGPPLAVEARAPDGVVEAFRVRAAQRFALAVQWHPEWRVLANPFSRALFAAFGQAAAERSRQK